MTKKGFTLIELLVVIVIIGILVAIALPNFIRIKDKAKEAEVKQNLHAVQLALERYAVDSPGSTYPLFPMGGDWTDSYVVWQSWVDDQEELNPLDITKYLLPGTTGTWLPAETDIGDALVMESYMPAYPGNPFIKAKAVTILPTITHCDYEGELFTRFIGGRDSNKMAEIFGPTYTWYDASVSGEFFVHHIFNNPPYDVEIREKDITESGDQVDWNSPSGNTLLAGNFSYYPRPTDKDGLFYTTSGADVFGYTLAGYGAVRTPGQDVYNRNGNYKGRYRTEPCTYDCANPAWELMPDDIECICEGNGNEGTAPNPNANNGGSDTLADGVVITLDSGVDSVSKRTNIGTT